MHESRGHQQVGVEPGVQLADLADKSADRDGVLDQPSDVGVMAAAGAGSASELGRPGLGEEDALNDRAQELVVDLASQVLKKPLELGGVPVGGRQELGRIELAGLDRLDLVDLGDQFAAEALDFSRDVNRIASLEARGQAVHLPEDPARGSTRSGP